ncbi:MAG: hypothetical protein AAGA48_21915 [Myxococcota bacterium]
MPTLQSVGTWRCVEEVGLAYYKDLGEINYFGNSAAKVLRAVGWLSAGEEVPRGPTEIADFRLLCEHLANAWQRSIFLGWHECEFCTFSGGPSSTQYEDITIPIGTRNLFLPAGDCIIVAPSTIAHYIDAHQYAPPQKFWEALRTCPTQRSMAYKRALLEAGGRHLLERPGRKEV